MIYFQDHDIKIRDICIEDIIPLFSWQIDKEINRYDPRPLPGNSKELLQECMDYCNRFETEIINENTEARKYKYFMITNNEDQPIGFVNFFSIDKVKRQGEMGVTIGDKRYWNRGIAYKTVGKAIEYIFGNMNIDRIYIETGEENVPSLKLFAKLGFGECGEDIEEDGFRFIVMERLREA